MTIFARPSEWTRADKQTAFAKPLAGGPTHYFAFLSYSHRDQETAEWLHEELESFRVPSHLVGRLTEHGSVPRRLTPIFRDLQELAASDDLGTEIREALAASRFLVVLCSPAAAGSRWTNAEIEAFKRIRPDGCIFAVIVDGEPFASDIPGREAEECLPRALRFKYDRRGRPTAKRAEPLAADIRCDSEERRMGFLKLVAGMVGVGLDDLVRRADIRRQKRLAVVAGGSLLGMLIATGLAVTAIQARDAARDQRREAEGMVAFMVGDLKDKLEPIGKLDALDGVASRVLAYYRKQDTSELSDAALLQRSRALGITAQVAYLRLNYDQAESLYRQATAGTAEAVRRSPDDTERVFDHAQNVFWLGELARSRGQTDRAVAAYSEYKRLGDRLVALEPDNLKWRMERLYGVENIGISLYNKRRYAEAARQFESALGPMQNLASIDPGNQTYRKELSTLLAWLADAQRSLGRLEPAIESRQRQVSLLNQAVAGGVTDVAFRSQLIPAHQGLGILLTWRGQSDRGIEELRAAVGHADRLIPVEPTNTYWQSLAAGARLELAKTLRSLGRRDEAAQETAKACSLIAAIRRADYAKRAACLAMRSRLALDAEKNPEALDYAQQALASARKTRSDDPLKNRYMAATIYRLIGDIRRNAGDGAGARVAWSNAFATLPQGVPEAPLEMDEHATILERLGRKDEAQPLRARLSWIGYRGSQRIRE